MLTVPRKHVSHHGPGKADINKEFCPNDNVRFILHDSEGFEPGEDAKFTVKIGAKGPTSARDFIPSGV